MAGISLDLISTLIGWFLVMWDRLNSNVHVAHACYNTKLIISQVGKSMQFCLEQKWNANEENKNIGHSNGFQKWVPVVYS